MTERHVHGQFLDFFGDFALAHGYDNGCISLFSWFSYFKATAICVGLVTTTVAVGTAASSGGVLSGAGSNGSDP
jgi:hypothetical protein